MRQIKYVASLIILVFVAAVFIGCGNEEPIAELTGNRIEYSLTEVGNSGLSGRVTILQELP